MITIMLKVSAEKKLVVLTTENYPVNITRKHSK